MASWLAVWRPIRNRTHPTAAVGCVCVFFALLLLFKMDAENDKATRCHFISGVSHQIHRALMFSLSFAWNSPKPSSTMETKWKKNKYQFDFVYWFIYLTQFMRADVRCRNYGCVCGSGWSQKRTYFPMCFRQCFRIKPVQIFRILSYSKTFLI